MQTADSRHFDLLRQWNELTDNELKTEYSTHSSDIEGRIVYLLERLGESSNYEMVVSSDSFPQIVRQLNRCYENGSKILSEVILKALDERDNGNVEKAISMFKKFSDSCSAPCYLEVAKNYIDELSKEQSSE